MEKLKDKVWHQLPASEVTQFLDVNLATGLSADEVRRRQKEHGPNRVTARRGTPTWLKFLKQLSQPLVCILLAAVGVTAFLGEWVDSSVIFGVVFINAIVGFLQEGLFFEDHSGEILQDDELSRLLTFPNILITAHQAFLTHEALSEIVRVTTANLVRFAEGQPFLEESGLASHPAPSPAS